MGARQPRKAAASSDAPRGSLYDKVHAVVVGISDFKTAPDLGNARGDAEAVMAALRKHYQVDEVHPLFDADARLYDVRKLFSKTLPGKIGPRDALFVFWAGHGTQAGANEVGYLVCHDGDMDPSVAGNLYMGELRRYLDNIQAKHKLVVVDACFSGLLASGRGSGKPVEPLNKTLLEAITRNRVLQVLTAGQAEQEVPDGGGVGGHSIFASELLLRLREGGSFVRGSELAAELRKVVPQRAFKRIEARIERLSKAAQQREVDKLQSPVFYDDGAGGDFVFVRKKDEMPSDG